MKTMLNEMIDAWKVFSALQERAPTRLYLNQRNPEQWRLRLDEDISIGYPIEELDQSKVIDQPHAEGRPEHGMIEWGEFYGTRRVSLATREVAEKKLRSLHDHLVCFQAVYQAQANLVGRILTGEIISEERVYKWEVGR